MAGHRSCRSALRLQSASSSASSIAPRGHHELGFSSIESHLSRNREPRPHIERLHWPELPDDIDRQLRELAQDLALHEVAFGRVLEAFFSADGWRRLGYATAAQYARERLGSSLSSIKAKRWLVKRLGELESLADALERGELGYEAARLVARIATPATVETWVTRASERTLQHLREEIDAAAAPD